MGIVENQILTGFNHTLAVKPDGTLWAWGKNDYGQLGLNDTRDRNAPVQVGADTDWESVAIGAFHSLAIRTDGTLWAAGYNAFGHLGVGDLVDRDDFIQVGSDTDWATAYPGGFHSLVLKDDQTVHAFGLNEHGQLGLGDTVNRRDPIEVGVSETWGDIGAGVEHSLGIKADGTLWGWGNNNLYQLGRDSGQAASTAIPYLAPIQIGTISDWLQVAAGHYHSVAVRTGNTLWGWGDNGAGQLGNGDSNRISIDAPTQIGLDTNWTDVRACLYFTVAKKTANTLWSAGDDEFGQLGQGALTDPFSLAFTQIGSDTDWLTPLVVGRAHVFAGKTGGSVFHAWGRNTEGQLGDGSNLDRNIPTLLTF